MLEPPVETGAIVCDFTFVDRAPMVVVHMVAGGSVRELLETRAYAQVNGYETDTVPNLGKGAFCIARDHKPWGLMALSGSDIYYAIQGQFSFARDIALTKALFELKFPEPGAVPRGAVTPMQGEALTGDGVLGNAVIVVNLATATTGQDDMVAYNLGDLSARGKPFYVGEDPTAAAFSDGGRYMAVATDDGIGVVELPDHHAYAPVPIPNPIALALVPGTFRP
jgi:hypothetical protein